MRLSLSEDIQLAAQAQRVIDERRRLVEHLGFERGMQWLEQSVPAMNAYAVTPDYRVIAYGPGGRTELDVWDVLTAVSEGHRISFGQ